MSERTAQAYMRLARDPNPQCVAHLSIRAALALRNSRRGQPMEVRFKNGTARFNGRTGKKKGPDGEHTTPPLLFAMFGQDRTFDACATTSSALCKEFYTKEDDGLKKPIPPGHNVWANPPYSQLDRWVPMLFAYVESGHGTVTALLPNWSDAKWYHRYLPFGRVTIIKGRWKFGGMKNVAPFPSIIVKWTPESIRAGRAREKAGKHSIVCELVDVKKSTPPAKRDAGLRRRGRIGTQRHPKARFGGGGSKHEISNMAQGDTD